MNFVSLLPSLAFAQADPSLPWWAQSWFLGLVTIVTGFVLPLVQKLLNENWKAAANSNLDDTVFDVVRTFGELEVKGIKAAAADGTIDDREKKRLLSGLLENAVTSVVKRRGGEKTVAKALGVDTDEVRDAVRGKVERVVTASKND